MPAGRWWTTREYEPYGQQLTPVIQDGPGYTGHVQDAATGLTYMQQRYYDPMIGRFLSVDPVTANGNTGRNFNRYKYAASNPYRFVDPDGRYECEKSVCAAVRSGLKELRSAMNSTANSEVRSALRGVLKDFGKEGVANGVTVKADTSGIGMANTSTEGGKTTIALNVERINSQADQHRIPRQVVMATVLSHEGEHGSHQRAHGMPATRAEAKAGEMSASIIEARAWQGLNTDSWWGTWTNAGGINEKAIEKQADAGVETWCAAGVCK